MAFSGVIYWVAYQLLGTQDLFLFFIETYTRLTHIVFADYHAPSYRALALYVQVTMPLVTMPLVTMPLVTMPCHLLGPGVCPRRHATFVPRHFAV